MSFFNRRIDVNEGGKCDATKVSDSGLSQEELAALDKKQRKAIDIFNKDSDKNLSKEELSAALSMYSEFAGEDGILTNKDFKAMAKAMGGDVSWKDLRTALTSMIGLMKQKDDLVDVNTSIVSSSNIDIDELSLDNDLDDIVGHLNTFVPVKSAEVKVNNLNSVDVNPIGELNKFVPDEQSISDGEKGISLDNIVVIGDVSKNREEKIISRTYTDSSTGEQLKFNYNYDEKGRKTNVKLSNGQSIDYTYAGSSNNIVSQILKDVNGNAISTTKYNYDKAGNFVSRETSFADGSESQIVYADDILANTKVLSDINVAKNYTDSTEQVGLVLSADLTTLNTGVTENHQYTYDSQGRKSIVNVSDGSLISYKYVGDTKNIAECIKKDAQGNIIQIQQFEYNDSGQKIKDIQKDASGNVLSTYEFCYADDGTNSRISRNSDGNVFQIDRYQTQADGSQKVTTVNIENNKVLFATEETIDSEGNSVNLAQIPVTGNNPDEFIAALGIVLPDNWT